VLTWTIAEPNCQIIEILPEMVLRMGYALENHKLTRSAFAILVSEEAFRIASAKPSLLRVDNPWYNKKTTLFGRPREAMDEDLINAIQHAGRSFAEKIESAIEDLVGPKMQWLKKLPDFAVLEVFDRYLDDNKHLIKAEFGDAKDAVAGLQDLLINFIRGRILWCALQPLEEHLAKTAHNHRVNENYLLPPITEFKFIYNGLTEYERYTTRFFWQTLNCLDWSPAGCQSNLLFDSSPFRLYFNSQQVKFAETHRVKAVSRGQIEQAAFRYDQAVRHVTDAVRNMRAEVKPTHSQTTPDSPTIPTPDPSVTAISNGLKRVSLNDMAQAFRDKFNKVTAKEDDTRSVLNSFLDSRPGLVPYLPNNMVLDRFHYHSNMTSLFSDVEKYLSVLCYQMISKGEQDWSTLCDTLLCVDENEYKYLPLWAGGMDDGSGGVFEEMIPPAYKGPIGPGPSYHTGSTQNSAASSEMDFERGSWTFSELDTGYLHTSLAVGDGHSDYIDRRYVVSEEDFPMGNATTATTAAEPSTSHAVAAASSSARPPSQGSERVGINDDEFMNVADEDEELDFDSDDDWDDGSLTDRE
jgi:hypothetical protein